MGGIVQPSVGIGQGQTWQDVTGSRSVSTQYTNTTGKPIMIWACWSAGMGYFYINGSIVQDANVYNIACAIIPAGATYQCNTPALQRWMELR